MERLVICAIPIDEVRDIFGADEATAQRLRELAAAWFAPASPPKKRWFSPLLKRDPGTELPADLPTSQDQEALLSGGFVPPARLPASWALLTAWLEQLAKATHSLPWNPAFFERAEWELAAAGLASIYSLRSLAERPLGLPLRGLPGQLSGYAKHVHVAETTKALSVAVTSPELSAEVRDFVGPIIEVLQVAAADDRLEVVVIGAASPITR